MAALIAFLTRMWTLFTRYNTFFAEGIKNTLIIAFFSVLLGYPKVVLEAFGAGGVPARLESAVRDLIQSGTRVYITTQCPEGGVHLHKYEVGRRAETLGAISLGSRTFEDALGALMCGEL